MRRLSPLLHHDLIGPLIRYGIAGALVASVYLGLPLLLNGVLGLWLVAATAIGYVVAITLHFNLQRRFVFRHVDEFALSVRQQIGRYVAIGAVQFPTTALAESLLPKALHVDARIVFVAVTIVISVTFFLLLRGHVFHPDAVEELETEARVERETPHPTPPLREPAGL